VLDGGRRSRVPRLADTIGALGGLRERRLLVVLLGHRQMRLDAGQRTPEPLSNHVRVEIADERDLEQIHGPLLANLDSMTLASFVAWLLLRSPDLISAMA